MLKLKLLVALLVVLVTGCGTSGLATTTERVEFVKVDTSCSIFKAIYLDKSDILSDRTAESILAHNETGRKRCGWKPVSPSKK